MYDLLMAVELHSNASKSIIQFVFCVSRVFK